MSGLDAGVRDTPRKRGFAFFRRLEEGAGGQRHGRRAHAQGRHSRLRDEIAMPRQSRQIMLLRNPCQRGCYWRVQRAGAANINIESLVRRRNLDVQRFSAGIERFRDRPSGLQGAIEALCQYRATIDGDDVVRARRRETNLKHVSAAATRMEYNTAPPRAVGIDQIVDRRVDTRLAERGHYQAPFPLAISLRAQMLDGATAANSEMPADWRNPLRARLIDFEELPPVRLAGHCFYFDGFARQRTGDIDRSVAALCNSVTALAETGDHQPLNHAGPR